MASKKTIKKSILLTSPKIQINEATRLESKHINFFMPKAWPMLPLKFYAGERYLSRRWEVGKWIMHDCAAKTVTLT